MFKENSGINFEVTKNNEKTPDTTETDFSLEKNILNQEEELNIKELTLNFFNNYLEKGYIDGDSFDAMENLDEEVNSVFKAENKDFDVNEEYGNKLRAANKIVVSSLLDFCEQNQKHPNFNKFLKDVRNYFFSSSPCLSSNLSIEDKFTLSTQATRSVETYGQIGGCMADDLVYSLSWQYQDEQLEEFLESFKKSSAAEKFDQIHFIKVLAANAAGTGSSENGLLNIHKILDGMYQETDSVLLRWAIDLAQEKVRNEEENPSSGIVKFSENVGNLRLNEKLSNTEIEEVENLDRVVLPNTTIDPNNKIMRVAADMLAIVDHSNMPAKYGFFSADEFEQKKTATNKISVSSLVKIESVISRPNKINFENLIIFLNDKILSPYYDDVTALPKAWSEIVPDVSLTDWADFLRQQEELRNLKDKLQLKAASITEDVENKNFEASKSFLSLIKKEIDLENLPDNSKQITKDFLLAYNSENFEAAYSVATDLLSLLRYQKSNLNLLREYNNLRSFHQKSFASGQGEIENSYVQAEEANKELLNSYYESLSSICSNPDVLLAGVAEKVNSIKNDIKKDTLEVSFGSYDGLPKDKQISNFIPEENNAETILLLKHMHRPDMESYINSNIGINLKEIPFRYQIYLLKFLSESSEELVKEAADFINNAQDEQGKLDRIKSFLSLRVELSDANRLISIGREMKDDSNLIFDKISQIVDLIDKKNEELQSLFFNKNSEINFSVVREKLLEKIHNIILDFSDNLSSEKNPNALENILNKLESSKTETLFLVSVLEALKNSGHDFDLDLIKNINLNISDYGQEISEQDKNQIINIAATNWADFDNKKMVDTVLDGLRESLSGQKEQRAYILKYKETVIGFVRFEKTDHGNVYAGSFNVSKDLRGLSVGNSLMEKALIEEGGKNNLEAAASIKISAACSYIEKVGFVADGLIDSYHGTGEKMFSIKLDNEFNKGLKTKKLSEAELQAKASDYKKINEILGESVIVLKFDLVSQMKDYEEALRLLLAKTDDKLIKEEDNKYLLTRYFQDKNVLGDVRYLVFEKN